VQTVNPVYEVPGRPSVSHDDLKALQEIYGVTADRMVAAAQKRLS
jgi:hypothetical protein